jgi:hypothetical protein
MGETGDTVGDGGAFRQNLVAGDGAAGVSVFAAVTSVSLARGAENG